MEEILDYWNEILCGLSLGLAVGTRMCYWKEKRIFDVVNNASELKAGKELEQGTLGLKVGESLKTALITGRVVPLNEDQVLRTNSGMNAVMQRSRVTEFRFGSLANYLLNFRSTIDVTPTSNFVPFAITDPNSWRLTLTRNASLVVVDDILKAHLHTDLFAKTNLKFEPSTPSFMGLIYGMIRGFYSVGMETSEYALPVDSVITILGQVTKLDQHGHYRISKASSIPYMITTKTASEVKKSLKISVAGLKALSILYSGVAIYLLITTLSKWYPKVKMFFMQSRVSEEISHRVRSIEGLPENQICVACTSNPREVALVPCGHICICLDCCLLIRNRCPICRNVVSDILPIYLS